MTPEDKRELIDKIKGQGSRIQILRIGNEEFGNIVEYKVQYNKMWGSDSGRTLDCTMVATLVGTVTKLVIKFGQMEQYDMQRFLEAVDTDFQYVTYFDPKTNNLKTELFYFGDVEASAIKIKSTMARYAQQSISIIGVKKR